MTGSLIAHSTSAYRVGGTVFAGTSGSLQWGRRLSTAETTAKRDQPDKQTELQWGRRLSTAETRRNSVGTFGAFNASMGPPSFNGGN